MIELIKNHPTEFVSLIVPVITALIGWLLRAKAKVVWSVHNLRAFTATENVADESGQTRPVHNIVHAASVFLRNGGRASATSIEIVFNWKPRHLSLWPQRDYTEATNPDGRYIIKLPSLGPSEFFGIDVLTVNADMPAVLEVRSAEGRGKRIEMTPQQIHPKWKLVLVAYLMLAGFVASLYLGLSILQFIILRSA